jgi:Na+-transporting NADH:ubiquinone oxidoreductase subunit A
MDLPLAGAPAHSVDAGKAVSRVALLGADSVGLKPLLLVQPGDRVLRGTPLFEDRKIPGARHTAPAAGTVAAIHRGERRAFASLIIDIDERDCDTQVRFATFTRRDPADLDGDAARALLVESGMWTALRTRPYSRVPAPADRPRAIFVTAIDTRPHAPPVARVLEGREDDFRRGVRVLALLTDGPVHVCTAADFAIELPQGGRVHAQAFAGPHPAGLPGTHIHLISPVGHDATAWHIGAADVAAIGHLFATGRLDVERVVSLAGPGVERPRLLRTRIGASLAELVAGELRPGKQRVISGSVLDGRTAQGDVQGYLGRYHSQVSALAEGDQRELFGWIAPGRDKFSLWGVTLGAFARRALPLTTTTNGSARAMVPIGAYERVMPLDILPTFLLRALITGDPERAEALGALELDEDDLALCTLVCPGKVEYGPLLRAILTRLEKEVA